MFVANEKKANDWLGNDMRNMRFSGNNVVSILGMVVTLLLLFASVAFGADSATPTPTPAAAPAAPAIDYGLQIDRLWVLIAGALVFFMQAGFLALEAGLVRTRAAPITAMKNIGDWMVCAICFFFIGWATMFGHTAFGYLGSDGFSLSLDVSKGWPGGVWIHFLFQLAFAGTAATIVSGALAERTGFAAYMIVSAVATALIYPVFGHWAWGNSFFPDNKTLLTNIGFLDFAGSTVVHSVGGWISFIGIIIVGPRLGRFGPRGEVRPMNSNSIAMSALGVLILWLAWWGFNGGSTLALNDQVGSIINNTNLAAAMGGIGSLLHCAAFQRKRDITAKFLSGILGGLVGITAGCNLVSPANSLVIGFTSGMLSNIATELLLKWRLDDPVGAVPVHLFCGIWGTLCVGLFGDVSQFPNSHTRMDQIVVQLIGIGTCGLWTATTACIMFLVLKQMGLRVSPEEELEGYDIGGVVEQHAETVADDHVIVEKAGGYNLISMTKFLTMPAKERDRLMTSGTVRFIKGGKVLSPEEALSGIKPRGHLLVLEGMHVGRRIPIVANITKLGKTGENSAVINSTNDGRCSLQALGESNKAATVNGQPVPADGVPLRNGDIIELLDTRLQFVK